MVNGSGTVTADCTDRAAPDSTVVPCDAPDAPSAAADFTVSVPAEIAVVPVNVFVPSRVSPAEPDFARAPAPEITPVSV